MSSPGNTGTLLRVYNVLVDKANFLCYIYIQEVKELLCKNIYQHIKHIIGILHFRGTPGALGRFCYANNQPVEKSGRNLKNPLEQRVFSFIL